MHRLYDIRSRGDAGGTQGGRRGDAGGTQGGRRLVHTPGPPWRRQRRCLRRQGGGGTRGETPSGGCIYVCGTKLLEGVVWRGGGRGGVEGEGGGGDRSRWDWVGLLGFNAEPTSNVVSQEQQKGVKKKWQKRTKG